MGEKVSPTTNRVVIRMIEWGSVHSVVYVSGCTRHATSFYGQKDGEQLHRSLSCALWNCWWTLDVERPVVGQSWSEFYDDCLVRWSPTNTNGRLFGFSFRGVDS